MEEDELNFMKFLNDYIKHVNTLSTGSILLVITFLQKLILNPVAKWLMLFSIISFLISVIGGVTVKTTVLYHFDNEKPSKFLASLQAIGILLLWIGFLAGIISLGVFGILNVNVQ